MSASVLIRMPRVDALALGLLACKCGHPANNHFAFSKRPCAHCSCRCYKEAARRGKLVEGRR